MTLREAIRETQILENEAADKAAARLLLIDEKKLLGSKSAGYRKAFIKALLDDIAPELIKAARLGRAMAKTIEKTS